MARPKSEIPIKRINTQVYVEDYEWLLGYYGSQYVAEGIRDLIREHRRRVETQNVAKVMRMEMRK